VTNVCLSIIKERGKEVVCQLFIYLVISEKGAKKEPKGVKRVKASKPREILSCDCIQKGLPGESH